MTQSFKKTTKQQEAVKLMASDKRFILLRGGGRSGKTLIIIYAIILRALKEPFSRHLIVRHAFNHAKQSLWYDTIPKCLEIAFPGVKPHMNKSDWFLQFDNGSQIWIGGLDDKERTEKILGNEYSSIYLNEISQISYSSFTLVITRLAQKTGLINRLYADCNPPSKRHWSYKVWFEGCDPLTNEPLKSHLYGTMQLNPDHNLDNLPEDYIENVLGTLSERLQKRFRYGEYGDDVDGLIFPNHRYMREDEQWPSHLTSCFGLDFGFNDPDGMVRVAIDRKINKMWWDEKIYSSGNSFDQLNTLISRHCSRNDLIIADCADARMISQLRRNFNIKGVNKKTWTVAEALKMMQDYEHIITQNSVNLMEEFDTYAWHDKKADVPEEGNDHLIDGGRYVFMETTSRTKSAQRWSG